MGNVVKYLNEKYPNRKHMRLPDFDYGQQGWYFVTICTHERQQFFGGIKDEQMYLTPCGQMVAQRIETINDIYDDVRVPKYVVMPDHVHIVIQLKTTTAPVKLRSKERLPLLVQALKAAATKQWHSGELRRPYDGRPTPLWQDGYHEHVVRNQEDYNTIWEYIEHNPYKWIEKVSRKHL